MFLHNQDMLYRHNRNGIRDVIDSEKIITNMLYTDKIAMTATCTV